MAISDEEFDAAYMIHVGMNISDKESTFERVFKALKRGTNFVIYDVMKMKEGQLSFPLPWAEKEEGSAVDSLDTYVSSLERKGFEVIYSEIKKDFAIAFFRNMMQKMKGEPPPLGLHLVMGADTPIKVQNVFRQIDQGIMAPVLLVARKVGET